MPRLGAPKGMCLLCRSGLGRLQNQTYGGREAYLKQDIDGPSGKPTCRETCHRVVLAIALEAFVNDGVKQEGEPYGERMP